MATVTTTFTVNMGGDLEPRAKSAAAAVQNLGRAADNTKEKAQHMIGGLTMAQSNMVSQFETVASLFTQMGGSISQVSIIASSAARPVATLAANLSRFGPAALAVGAAAGAVGVLAGGLLALRGAANAAVDARQRLDEMGVSIQSQDLDTYEDSVSDLTVAMDKLKVAIGEGAAREMSQFNAIVSAGVSSMANWYKEFARIRDQGGGLPISGAIMAATANWWNGTAPGMRPDYGPSLDWKPPATSEPPGRSRGPTPADMALFMRQQRYESDTATLASSSSATSDIDMFLEAMDPALKAQAEARAIWDRLVAATRENTDATEMLREEQAEAARLAAKRAETTAAMGALGSGSLTGIAGLAGGPAGALVTSLIGSFQSDGGLTAVFKELFQQVQDIFLTLPNQIDRLATRLVPYIIRELPDLVAAYSTLGPEVAVALAGSFDEIGLAIVDAILDLPRAFGDAVERLGDRILDAINPFRGDGGGRGGGSERARELMSPFPMDAGTGYRPPMGSQARSRGATTRQIARALQRDQGTYGFNLHLDALV